MATLNAVINQTTKQLKRYGYCDFENDGSFVSESEDMVDVTSVGPPTLSANTIEDSDAVYWDSGVPEWTDSSPV